MSPTGSKIALLMACAYPFNGQAWPESETGDAARLGQAWHEVAAKAINTDMTDCQLAGLYDQAAKNNGLTPEQVEQLYAMAPDAAAFDLLESCGAVRVEVAYAWDWKTGKVRELGVDIGRNYRVSATEVAGTADVVGVSFIADWKTGKEAPKAENNAQLMFLAMCAAKLGHPIERIQILHVKPDGSVWTDTCEVTEFDLEAFEAELRREIQALPGAFPTAGKHCRYCPMVAVCPKTVETVAEPSDSFPLALYSVSDIVSPEHAAWLLHRIEAAESMLGSVKAMVRKYADEIGHIPLADGKKWGPYQVTRETIVGSRDKLLAAGVPEELIEYSVAKGAVEEFAKRGAPKGKGAAAVRAMLNQLREADCIKESTFIKYEARK